jgi:hypothetical protein
MRALLAFVSVLAAGCVDPAADLDAFQARLPKNPAVRDSGTPDASGDAASCGIQPGDAEGQYLLAISASIAPAKPIVALTSVTTPKMGEGAGIALSAQPLSAADRTTPVGPVVSFGPFAIDDAGNFRADIPALTVPGAANPITPGADITADLVLSGKLCGVRRFYCGNVSGQVSKPLVLDLEGSTFTLTLIDPGEPVPVVPPIDCSGKLADPL